MTQRRVFSNYRRHFNCGPLRWQRHSSSFLFLLLTCIFFLITVWTSATTASDILDYPGTIQITPPNVITTTLNFDLSLAFSQTIRDGACWPPEINFVVYTQNDKDVPYILMKGTINTNPTGSISGLNLGEASYVGTHLLQFNFTEPSQNYHFHEEIYVFAIPAWITILPSLLCIVLAIWLRQNILALFAGVWLGTTFTCKFNPGLGLLRALDTIIIKGIYNVDNISVIYLCLVIGGMITVIVHSGGAAGMATLFTKLASTRQRSMFATWCVGCCTFFDDYASCLITGSTMRDITGLLFVSREKLSFIVDTCAATVSSLMIISSWIGVELSLIGVQLEDIGKSDINPYTVFLNTILYRFYPLHILLFCLFIILFNRDFGPMLAAERRAVKGQIVRPRAKCMSSSEIVDDPYMKPKPNKPQRWVNAILPFLLVVIVIVAGVIVEGYFNIESKDNELKRRMNIALGNNMIDYYNQLKAEKDQIDHGMTGYFSYGSPFHGLIWAGFFGSLAAIVLVMWQRILTLSEAMEAWFAGTKSMLFAILILMHAWGLGSVCGRDQLNTSAFLSSFLEGRINAGLLPMIVFILGALMSFSTGTAWGTMGVMFPLMVPLAHRLAPDNWVLLLGTISSILAGAVWGNHTSPIADSCIMSSLSTNADHNDHVKTQAVYAIVVGLVSIITCSLPVGLEWYPWYVGHIIAVIVILLILFTFGKHPEDPEERQTPVVFFLYSYTPFYRWSLVVQSKTGHLYRKTPFPRWISSVRSKFSRKQQEKEPLSSVSDGQKGTDGVDIAAAAALDIKSP